MQLRKIINLKGWMHVFVVNLLQAFEEIEAMKTRVKILLLLHQHMEREWIVPLRKTKLKEKHQGNDVWLG